MREFVLSFFFLTRVPAWVVIFSGWYVFLGGESDRTRKEDKRGETSELLGCRKGRPKGKNWCRHSYLHPPILPLPFPCPLLVSVQFMSPPILLPDRNWSGVKHGRVKRERELICLFVYYQSAKEKKYKVGYKKMKKVHPTHNLPERTGSVLCARLRKEGGSGEDGGTTWFLFERRIYYVCLFVNPFVCWNKQKNIE